MNNRLLAFLVEFYRNDPRASRRALLLVIVGGALEGVSVMLFLPFFQAIAELSAGSVSVPLVGTMRMPGWMTPKQLLLATCGLFFVVATLRVVVIGLRDAQVFKLVLRFVDGLRLRLFRSVAASPWRQQAEIEQSEIESAMISGTERVRAAAVLTSLSAIDVVMVAVQSGILIYISPSLAALSLAMISIALVAIYPLIRKSFDLGMRLTSAEQNLHRISTEFLTDLKTAKSQNLESGYTAHFADAVRAREVTMTGFRFRQIFAQGLLQFVVAAVAIVILLTGVFLLAVDTAITLLTVIVLARLTIPVFRLYSNFQVLAHTLPVYATLTGLIGRFGEAAARDIRPVDLAPDRWAGPVLEIEDMTFTRADGVTVLNDISLALHPGESVALFGQSGAGKTTFLDVILGLHAPSGGQVRYFGRPATQAAAIAFRDLCSYVPQDAFLMSGTIRSNLRWICPDASEATMRAALDSAMAPDLQLDQDVGTRGARLSGGERQRVRLAQALLRRPRVLVLDEALNAVGQDTVGALLRSLRAFDDRLVLLYVTHRLPDLELFDRVFELSGQTLHRRLPGEMPNRGGRNRQADARVAREGSL